MGGLTTSAEATHDRFRMTHPSSLSSPPSSSLSLDLARIRAQFPALARQHGGHPVAYFDGPGGTQVPRGVADAISDYLFHHNANTHWNYPTSAETDAIIADGRAALASFLNASADEIVFGANMTSLTFHPGPRARAQVAAGRRTDRHGAGSSRQRRFVARGGRRSRPDGEDGPRALTFGRAGFRRSRGGVQRSHEAAGDRRRIERDRHDGRPAARDRAGAQGRRAGVRRRGALRAAFAGGRARARLRPLGCSTAKFYGPHMGVLYGKKALIEALDAPKLRPAPDEAPERLETGTQNHEGIAGAAAAVDFLGSLASGVIPAAADRRAALEASFDAMHAEGERRLAQLWNGLAGIPGVTLYGRRPGENRTPTVGFTVAGHDLRQGGGSAGRARRVRLEREFLCADAGGASRPRRPGRPGPRRVRGYIDGSEEVDRLVEGVRSLVAPRQAPGHVSRRLAPIGAPSRTSRRLRSWPKILCI